MKRIFLIILFICVIIQSGKSQEKENAGVRILFQGLVMDANTLAPVPNSQIMINRAFSSISGKDGEFAFYVNWNDTVIFKSLGYKATILHVSDTLKEREFITGIFMNKDTVSIGEVIIVPRVTNLKSEILNARSKTPETFDNARYNVAVSAYQGRNSQSTLGDPADNYSFLIQKQKVNAYEKGGIPYDRIIGLNPLLLIPAAYLLIHKIPEKPEPLEPQLTVREVEQIHEKYLEVMKKRN